MNAAADARRPSAAGGATLIELLISVLLGLLLISAALSTLLATSRTNRALDGLSRLQESGRFALYIMERDVRMAGYRGCALVRRINHVTRPTATAAEQVLFDYEIPYYGFGPGDLTMLRATLSAFNLNYARGDVLLVKNSAEPFGADLGADVPPNAAAVSLATPAVPPFGQLMMLSNCSGNADVFQVATDSQTPTTSLSRAAEVDGLWPGNGTVSAAPFSVLYRADQTELTLAQSNLYYIGFRVNPDGTRDAETSLRRLRVGAAMALPDEELVDGVYDLRVQYGIDNNSDGGADEYLRAEALTSRTQWNKVVALRIAILAYGGDEFTRSAADGLVPVAADPSIWDYPDDRFTPTDWRLYRFFSTTVATRNRVP